MHLTATAKLSFVVAAGLIAIAITDIVSPLTPAAPRAAGPGVVLVIDENIGWIVPVFDCPFSGV